MLNTKKMLTKIAETLSGILTRPTITEISMPYTPTKDGIIFIRVRCSGSGRTYEYFNNLTPTGVEAYNVADGYIFGCGFATKGNQVSVSTRSNVKNGEQRYWFIPYNIGGGIS